MTLLELPEKPGVKGAELISSDEFVSLANAYSGWVPTQRTTDEGTAYFTSPGVMLLSKPDFNPLGLQPFLKQFDEAGGADDPLFFPYVSDNWNIPGSTALSKVAGQLCYLSFGQGRTWNRDAGDYLENIRKQKHGSVLEHPNFSFLFWGISRSLTHELVRHRAGFAYSQVSQRYVDGRRLRFVRRPEFSDAFLAALFEDRIDEAAARYEEVAERLQDNMRDTLAALPKTDRRKAVNQAARALLPNETEAPIVTTANVRAWRHFLNMRGSLFAEPEIRTLAIRVLVCLWVAAPESFADFEIRKEDGGAGRTYLYTPHEKV